VCRPDGTREVASSFVDRLGIAGPVALVHEAPQNAPVDGRQLNVLYDTMPMPVYVDWNIWPLVPARPGDVTVLFEREPMEPSERTFHAILDELPRGEAFDRTQDVLDRFRVFMTPIIAKHAVRGWFESVDRMLGYLDISAEPIRTKDTAMSW
jgi:hypothetical protein